MKRDQERGGERSAKRGREKEGERKRQMERDREKGETERDISDDGGLAGGRALNPGMVRSFFFL